MRRFLILTLSLICVTLVATGVSAVAPKWTHSVGLDFWNAPNERIRLRNALDEGRSLDSRSEQNFQWIRCSEHISGAFVAQECVSPMSLFRFTLTHDSRQPTSKG
jgi:hypothetical protein